ncbi:hypothetical protein CDAR_213221 [Caerostris darwini]|uniref:Uncharacterized protein n=1 Tax=Caerostris darwini TaxID=1538125 RepID=A0AAV4PW22_9ARAC|nr:hypothetical protein CDAR_213221 [Caerostris darwini]
MVSTEMDGSCNHLKGRAEPSSHVGPSSGEIAITFEFGSEESDRDGRGTESRYASFHPKPSNPQRHLKGSGDFPVVHDLLRRMTGKVFGSRYLEKQ